MLVSNDFFHKCSCLFIRIVQEEEDSFVPSDDQTDGLAEISLEEYTDKDLQRMLLDILTLYHQLLPTVHGRHIFL